MNDDASEMTPKNDSRRIGVAAPAKAKIGDVVTYWEEQSVAPRHAIVLGVGADNAASLKVIMPATRKGGGGVVRRDSVAFADKATAGCWGTG